MDCSRSIVPIFSSGAGGFTCQRRDSRAVRKIRISLVRALLILSTIVTIGCRASAKLDSYGDVSDFTLTDQTGASFSSATELHGVDWIADFIYTTCPGPCPRMTSQMHQVQKELASIPGVRLVSFTVDPANDTPPVLDAYAKRFGANPAIWFFLTGPEGTLHHLSRDVFKLGDVTGNLEHSTRFVLIDRKSRIRGYYLTSEPGAISRLVADTKALGRRESD